MSSLDDIAPPSIPVSINGTEHRVVGVPFRVLMQAPELIGFLMGSGLDANALMQKGPDTVALIIAAGFGSPDDEKAKKRAADLPFDVQIDLLAAILKATIGGGTGPFVEKLAGLRKLIEIEEKPTAEVEKIRLKTVQRTSPQPLNSSLPGEDIPIAKSGT